MKKIEKRYDQMGLSDRLVSVMMIYLDGLGPKKTTKMKKYLDEQVGVIVDHYIMLLKKKNAKTSIPSISVRKVAKYFPATAQNNETDMITGTEKDVPINSTEKELIEEL
ncbi:hypothetical protein [Lacibacter sediminis]|uniref:Uncharacterized protein n=1 Tax=Lacibacter sediminis TaxID=2760713 RepID=A0A7G5XK99_9BACT|nr:hypothetical protein [Lacibacter sediminis]QNA45902.1 hypothetical protein H4075_06840 [Lacibacter sediminis]